MIFLSSSDLYLTHISLQRPIGHGCILGYSVYFDKYCWEVLYVLTDDLIPKKLFISGGTRYAGNIGDNRDHVCLEHWLYRGPGMPGTLVTFRTRYVWNFGKIGTGYAWNVSYIGDQACLERFSMRTRHAWNFWKFSNSFSTNLVHFWFNLIGPINSFFYCA